MRPELHRRHSTDNPLSADEQEPMTLFIDPSTNVALPLFEPTSSGTEVAFDSEGRMNIQSYLNDTVDPPTDSTNAAYYRWYVLLPRKLVATKC